MILLNVADTHTVLTHISMLPLLRLCTQMFRIRSSQRGVVTLPPSVTTFAEAQAWVEANPKLVPLESHYVWQYERVDAKYASLDVVPVANATTDDGGDGVTRHANAFKRIKPLLSPGVLCDAKGADIVIRDLDHAQAVREQVIAAACGTHVATEVDRILTDHLLGGAHITTTPRRI